MKTEQAVGARIRGSMSVYVEPKPDGKFTVHKSSDHTDITQTLTRNEFAHCKRVAATRPRKEEPSDGKRN